MLHELAEHKGSKIVEGHRMSDHIHMCISIPPKYAVSNVVGYIKGKGASQIARKYGVGSAISPARISGHGGITYPPSG